jgi:hypothetical protein
MPRSALFAALGCLTCLVALPACQVEHTVQLQLGDDPARISQGMLCRADGDLLFERGHDLVSGAVELSLVIDVVALGDVLPGCLPEELRGVCRDAASCPIAARSCQRLRVAGPTGRRLAELSDGERVAFVAALAAELRALPPLFRDAPDGPVVVRAVATTEPCEQLRDPAATSAFVPTSLMGCAYSCPVLLDELDGALRLGFSTSEPACEPQVRGCAAYPL